MLEHITVSSIEEVVTIDSPRRVKMLRTSDRKSQIRLFKAELIRCFEVNACRAAKIDQIGNDLLILEVFTNVQNQRAAKIDRGNVAFTEIRPGTEIEVSKSGHHFLR